MSNKVEATTHGRDIVDRLRLLAPYSEEEPVMLDAADEIEALRAKLVDADRRAIPQEGFVIQIPAEQRRYLR